ncbi:hypothetical protein ACFYOK_35600 [Microbispora bryophytorum]|uniref:hypothetical protein n=1 Tax=Microbispora bryophytorum TaxID=1460882 RepID=UPI0033CEDCD4
MRYRSEHFVADGSLRDIVVLDTDIEDWQQMLSSLASSAWEVSLSVDLPGGSQETPVDARRLFEELESNGDSSARLEIRVDGASFRCYFFQCDEIEFTFDPIEVQDEISFEAVAQFMVWLGDLSGKRVIMTMETTDHATIPALLDYVPTQSGESDNEHSTQ